MSEMLQLNMPCYILLKLLVCYSESSYKVSKYLFGYVKVKSIGYVQNEINCFKSLWRLNAMYNAGSQ